jgi:hypothetical protein
MEAIYKNLAEIEEWIANAPSPINFKSNDEFMEFMVQVMNHTLYMLRVGASLAPNEEVSHRGFTKQKAIVVGHIVRIAKLYEGLLIHTAKRQLELATIFNRLIFESVIKVLYLMQAKRKSFRSFIITSYKPEKEMLKDLADKAAKRPLVQIERRMRRKVRSRLKSDGISMRELMANKTWNLDGKDFRRILDDVGYGAIYAYGFGSSSHTIHGDWHDIRMLHLRKNGRYYLPDLSYGDPDPRIVCSQTILCLNTLHDYLTWSKVDSDNFVRPIVKKLLELTRAVDTAHESTLGD